MRSMRRSSLSNRDSGDLERLAMHFTLAKVWGAQHVLLALDQDVKEAGLGAAAEVAAQAEAELA
jgi:hypothetical protein